MHRIDVMGDSLLVVIKLYPTSNPSAPYLRGVPGGQKRARVLRAGPLASSRLGVDGWCCPCLRDHGCDEGMGGDGRDGGRLP